VIADLLHFLFEGNSELGINGALLSGNKYVSSAAYSALSSLAKMTPAALGMSHAHSAIKSFITRTNNVTDSYFLLQQPAW
jgi:hypothetical protein